MNIEEKLKTLILQNNLGLQVTNIQQVLGGLSHNMYKVGTDRATFAVKVLDHAVMRRKEAYGNFVLSEKIARIAKQNGVNAVCALQLNGEVVLKVEDSFFMIFDWLNGQTLNSEQVTVEHCEVMGHTLANIHNIKFFDLPNHDVQNEQTMFDFASYVPLAMEQNKSYAQNLQNSANLLVNLSKKSAEATNVLSDVLVVSHRDLDRKNVMWQSFTPYIIDWEASGLVNPTSELVQVAWYWSGGDAENLDLRKFETLVKSYVDVYRGKLCINYADLVYANMSPKLAWLQYNLQRSLVETPSMLADCEVSKSLKELEYCAAQFDSVLKVLKTCF